MDINYNINKEPYDGIAEWELSIQQGENRGVEDILHELHKKVWSSSDIIPERLTIYEHRVEDYRRMGFDVGEHSYYVLLYNYMLRRKK